MGCIGLSIIHSYASGTVQVVSEVALFSLDKNIPPRTLNFLESYRRSPIFYIECLLAILNCGISVGAFQV